MCITAVAMVFWADAIFPPTVAFTAFYCIPVALAAWAHGFARALPYVLAAVAAGPVDAAWFAGNAEAAESAIHRIPSDLLLYLALPAFVAHCRARIATLHASSETNGRLALRDRLTGLPNRMLLQDRLAVAMSLARRNRRKAAIFYLDLDGFKPVNDRYGHATGDLVLREVARRLHDAVRAADTAARVGGDEFAVVLNDLARAEDAIPVVQKVIEAIARPIALPGMPAAMLGASVGIAIYPDHALEIDRLIRVADQAMYEAKAAGGCRYVLHAEAGKPEPTQPWLEIDAAHETGVEEIDAQHRQLAGLVNHLHDAVVADAPTPEVAAMLEAAVLFARFHFACEERMMAQHGYPELAAHRAEHARLDHELAAIATRITEGHELVAVQTLKDWLLAHIAADDRPFGAFLNGR